MSVHNDSTSSSSDVANLDIHSSAALDEIFNNTKLEPGCAVTYLYFDFHNASKQSYESLLRSLIVQLSIQLRSLPRKLEKFYKQKLDGYHELCDKDLLAVFREQVENVSLYHIYIFIDALDECNSRDQLLEFIITVNDWNISKLHILVTSRKERDITKSIDPIIQHNSAGACQCLETSLVDPDIRLYILDQLHNDPSLNKWPDALRSEIEETLMAGAGGMYVSRGVLEEALTSFS